MWPEAFQRAINYECYRLSMSHKKERERDRIISPKGQDEFIPFLLTRCGITNTSENPLMNILEGQMDEIRSDLKL